MTPDDLSALDKDALIEMLLARDGILKKKQYQLRTAREKLNFARTRLNKMKDIIAHQRERLLQYHLE